MKKTLLNSLAWLLLVLALLPSSNYHSFNGLPLSGLAEYALLLSLLPFLLLRKYSRLHSLLLQRLSPKLPFAFLLLALLAGSLKTALYLSGTHTGFPACYSSPASAPTAGTCERSYENPFNRFAVTRLDPSISFDLYNWNLGFVNSNRFNYYAWEPNSIDRNRLPLTVQWSGDVRIAENQRIAITYTGTGQIQIGSTTAILPTSYQEARQLTLTPAPGIQPLAITYTFDDSYRLGDPAPGEYAILKIEILDPATGVQLPLAPLPPAVIWRILAALVDIITFLLWASLLAVYVLLLKRRVILLLVVFLAGWGTMVAPAIPGLTHPRLLLLLMGALFAIFFFQRRVKHNLLFAFLCFASLGLFRVLMDSHGPGTVIVLFGGTDQLTYESFARTILETGSLRAGEDIFYYQPAFRYLVFLLHLLLGEGSNLSSALAVALLNWGILFLSLRLIQPTTRAGRRLFMLGIAFVILLLVSCSQVSFDLIMHGTSEYPTWIILSIALALILSARPEKTWWATSLLIGLGMIIRTNQVPALGLLYLLFVLRSSKTSWRKIIPASLALLLFVFLLPAWHNLYYGGKFVVLPTSGNANVNLAIPPLQALTSLNNPETRAFLVQQIKDLAGFTDLYKLTMNLILPMHVLQVLWLIACLTTFVRWRATGWTAKLILLLPVAFLSPYIFYSSWLDYPRHILAGLLAMGYGALVFASGFGQEGVSHYPRRVPR